MGTGVDVMQAKWNENRTKTERKEDGTELKLVQEHCTAGMVILSNNCSLSKVHFLFTRTCTNYSLQNKILVC